MTQLKKDGKNYWVLDRQCIGRACLALGSYQHRGASGAGLGTHRTGQVMLCCLTNAYHGCPEQRPYDKKLARERRAEGIKTLCIAG
jgi:hypothetical protein